MAKPEAYNPPQEKMPRSRIEVFFATNRNIEGTDRNPTFGTRFHPEGPFYVRYGKAEVTPPSDWGSDDFEVASVRLSPERISKSGRAEKKLGSSAVFDSLRERMRKDESDTLVLIHGYASEFENAMKRAAEIKLRYQFDKDRPLNVFAFSWPADGEMIPQLSYYRDRDDAKASGMAIARAFLRLRQWIAQEVAKEDQCRHRLHLVAHSMGNYALRHAVQAIRSQLDSSRLERAFDNIFLMASDEDDDAFELDHKFGPLPDLARAVHVYFSANDEALVISDVTKFNPDRLGHHGPRNKDNLPRKVSLVNCSAVDKTRLTHARHQYYRLRPEVYRDVRQVLAGVEPRLIDGREFLSDDRAYRIKSLDERKAEGGAGRKPFGTPRDI